MLNYLQFIKEHKFWGKSTYNESNRFLHMKEVLDTIEDMCLDLKDDGFDIIFGIMPHGLVNNGFANFDENLDDIQIKKASLGKSVIYIKFDISKNLIKFGTDERILENFIETIISVYKYLQSEDLLINSLWTKEMVVKKNRSDHGRSEFFLHGVYLNSLVNHIDWSRSEKLSNIVGKVDNIKVQKNDYSFRQLLDVRIAFSGQPLIEESKDFRVDIGVKASESDYENLKDIIDDFNQNNQEDKDGKFEATIGKVRTKTKYGKGYIVMIHDKSSFYDGFQMSDVSSLILRLMSELETESIETGILFIGDPDRKNITLTKNDLVENKVFDAMGNLIFYIDIID